MLINFENYSLDADRRELRRGGQLVAIEPQVFDLLVYLVENRDRVVTKDDVFAAVWNNRIVSESTLTSRINAVRKAVDDSGENQRLIRTIARKGFRFVGEVSDAASAQGASQVPKAMESEPPPLRQEVRFCTAPDGVRLAFAEVGQGPPLVRTGRWLTHLEYDWESPVWRPFLHELAAGRRVIRYDARGNGLSDWDAADISFEAFVRDLETVIEASGVKRFALLGMSQGVAVSIAYAVRHPERVSHLLLYGGFSRGRRRRGSPQHVATSDAMATLIREGWGQENPAFRQLFTSLFIPDATPEQVQWFNNLQRVTTSPDNAARLRETMDNIEVSELLAQVKTPTLVLHSRDDAAQPLEEGRRIAAAIPGARLAVLEGRNHIFLKGDPAWRRFFEEIDEFLRH